MLPFSNLPTNLNLIILTIINCFYTKLLSSTIEIIFYKIQNKIFSRFAFTVNRLFLNVLTANFYKYLRKSLNLELNCEAAWFNQQPSYIV